MNQIRYRRPSNGRPSNGHPDKTAFLKAADHKIDDSAYGSKKMLKFFEVMKLVCWHLLNQSLQLTANQFASDKQMILPGFLVAVSNAMGLSKVFSFLICDVLGT